MLHQHTWLVEHPGGASWWSIHAGGLSMLLMWTRLWNTALPNLDLRAALMDGAHSQSPTAAEAGLPHMYNFIVFSAAICRTCRRGCYQLPSVFSGVPLSGELASSTQRCAVSCSSSE